MSRKRSENFTVVQKEFVIDYVRSNRIIESKDLSLKMLTNKKKVWSDLATNFNDKFETIKSVPQLKVLWKGLKSKTKKNIACLKRETHATGGGENLAPTLSVSDEEISEIISSQLEPLQCSYDGDAGVGQSDKQKIDVDIDSDHISDNENSQAELKMNLKRPSSSDQKSIKIGTNS